MIELGYSSRNTQPYINIGMIEATWADGSTTRGTCSLVGRNDILTAGHCVYDPDEGGWAVGFQFYFGTDYNSTTGIYENILSNPSYSTWNASAWTSQIYTDVDNNTMLQSESQYDVALIGIDAPIGDSLGWLGLAPAYNGNQAAVAVGYPAGSTGMMMESASVATDSVYGVYKSASEVMGPGSSGGPLLKGNYVIGVKSTGYWWADIGNSFIYDELVSKLSENDSLLDGSDTTTPTVSAFNPADEATNIAIGGNIVVTFTEDIQRGSGSIILKTSVGTVVETFNAASSNNLSISGDTLTINPSADLSYGTSYKVEFAAGSIKDLAGNSYPGTTSYNFTTLLNTSVPTNGDDTLVGSSSEDILLGLGGNDVITGGAGNDWIDGGFGNDTAQFSTRLAGYTVTRGASTFTVQAKAGSDGTDTLTSVEKLTFADMTVNLTVQAVAAAAPQTDVQRLEELYVAFFNRVPDADGLEYWINQYQAGSSINQIAEVFYRAGVQYSDLTGFSSTMSNADFVNVVYKNVLGRADGADAEGLAYWSNALASGQESHGSLVSTILSSAHTFKGNATWGWVADLLDNKVLVANTFAVEMGLNYNTPEESISQGMQIAAFVTPTNTDVAIALIGVTPEQISL